jgi:hypothetical protein
MNDALEILDELDTILAMNKLSDEELIAIIFQYVEQKRTEFQPACGECGT